MRSPNQKRRFPDTTSLAGWLFADLFLGLIIVFMASSSADISSRPRGERIQRTTPTATATSTLAFSSTPRATTTATTTPTPSTTSTLIAPSRTPIASPTAAVGLDLKQKTVIVYVDDISLFLDNNKRSIDSFFAQFDREFPDEYRNRQAGLVIALGYHTDGNIPRARQLANHGVQLLQSEYPEIFSNIVIKTYWWDTDESRPIGTIEFEIYFYTK